MKRKIKEVGPHATLYRDDRTGIAWIEDGRTGNGHSAHPNIDASGSVRGMRKLGYWGTTDRVVRADGCYFNIDRCVITDQYDTLAAAACRCGGRHPEAVFLTHD